MADILVEKTSEDAASKSLHVTVPVDRVRQAETRAVQYFARRARLPGFRPGKAPEGVVRKRYTDAIRQSVLEEIIRESWETARNSESLQPVADPSIRNLKFEEGRPVEFELLVEVRPELNLARTGGFRVTRPAATVTDAAVDEQLEQLREEKAAWLPVEGMKPVPGQLVRVDVVPLDQEPSATSQPYSVILGQGQAIPDLEEKIMTLLPGESVDAEVRFPDDHPDASRRGQTRRVRVTLHEVKRQELAPLDDAFAREVGEFEDLAGLRAAVRADLERAAEHEADASVRQQLIKQVVDANNVPAPESLVHRFLHAYADMYKVPPDQLAGFEAQFRPVAVSQVQRDLVLETLATQQNLRATEADLDQRIASMAAARNLPAGELYATLQKANRLPELERSLTEEKMFEFLLQQSTVEEAGA
ncbi:MAG TPA: trigger factor [Gemmatimonadales bacterium]|nr:trigger factor [Gemmatimonadales bacterium]